MNPILKKLSRVVLILLKSVFFKNPHKSNILKYDNLI